MKSSLLNWLLILLVFTNIFIPITTLVLIEISETISFQNYLPLLKDLVIYGIILLFFFSLRKVQFFSLDYLFVILIISSWLISVMISDSSLYGIVLNTRRIYLPLVFAFCLYKIKLDRNVIGKLFNFSFYILILGALFDGLLGEYLWDGLFKVERYWSNDTQPGLPIETFRESSRAFTPDLVFLVGKEFRRLYSILLEPTTFGSLMTYFFAYYLAHKRYGHGLVAGILGVLAFSKIALLAIISIPFIGLVERFKKSFFIAVFLLLCFLSMYLASLPELTHGSFSHIIGISTALMVVKDGLFGAGLGMGGNRPGIELDGIHLGRYGGESGFGNVFFQSPVLGMIYLFLFLLLLKRNYPTKLIWVFFLNFMLSATSLGLTSILYPILYFSSYDKKNI